MSASPVVNESCGFRVHEHQQTTGGLSDAAACQTKARVRSEDSDVAVNQDFDIDVGRLYDPTEDDALLAVIRLLDEAISRTERVKEHLEAEDVLAAE